MPTETPNPITPHPPAPVVRTQGPAQSVRPLAFVTSTGGPAKPVRNGEISSRPEGTHRPRPNVTTAPARAFTLIELLVVISIVVLLMALLFPALRRARRQAETVACQANLHQWALFLQQYTSENDGRWVRVRQDSHKPWDWWRTISASYCGELKPVDQCPTKRWREDGRRRASVYGVNYWIHDCQHRDTSDFTIPYYWRCVDATRSPGRVPVLLDGAWGWTAPFPADSPPPTRTPVGGP